MAPREQKKRRKEAQQEHREERKRKRIRRTLSSSTQSPSSSSSQVTCSLPHDLTSEILSKLPAKSIVRFRCVSKEWSSTTTNPYFTASFQSSSSTRPSLLLCSKRTNELFIFSVLQHRPNLTESCTSSEPIDCYRMVFPEEHKYFSPTESVHGLICFQTSASIMLWNPSIRQVLAIPKPPKSTWMEIRVILGYDPIEGKHKIVCFHRHRSHDECQVLTLGSKTWRSVEINHKHSLCRYARCINGVVYYKARDQGDVGIIMSFDVRTEKFAMIDPPKKYEHSGILINYEGMLASVISTPKGGIRLSIWEGAEKDEEWTYRYFSALKHHEDQSLKTVFKVKGMTDAGEFVYAPSSTSLESFYILYFDSKRKTFRKVEFDGVKESKFMRRNKLGDMSSEKFHIITNHSESLIPF